MNRKSTVVTSEGLETTRETMLFAGISGKGTEELEQGGHDNAAGFARSRGADSDYITLKKGEWELAEELEAKRL